MERENKNLPFTFMTVGNDNYYYFNALVPKPLCLHWGLCPSTNYCDVRKYTYKGLITQYLNLASNNKYIVSTVEKLNNNFAHKHTIYCTITSKPLIF